MPVAAARWSPVLCLCWAQAAVAKISVARSPTPAADEAWPEGFLGHLDGHKASVYALAASGNDLLASGAKDGSLAVWNLTGLPIREGKKPSRRLHGHSRGVTALAFLSADVLLSGAADNSTRMWDLRTKTAQKVIGHPRTVFGLAVRPRRTNATAAQRPPRATEEDAQARRDFATACWDGVLRVFTGAGQLKGELHGHDAGVYAVSFSPLDGSLLASASADRTVRIWDADRMKLLWTWRAHGDHATSVDWSPLEPFALASGGWDRKFRLWEIDEAEVRACRRAQNCSSSFTPRAVGRHPQLVWKVAFAPGGDLVAACHGAVGQSPTVVLYQARDGKVVRRLGRHKDTPLTIAWAPSGSVLASGGMDHKVLLYDGRGHADDLPVGDADDEEEQDAWRTDLLEWRTGRKSNATTASDTNKSRGDAAAQPWAPHPLAGRMAHF